MKRSIFFSLILLTFCSFSQEIQPRDKGTEKFLDINEINLVAGKAFDCKIFELPNPTATEEELKAALPAGGNSADLRKEIIYHRLNKLIDNDNQFIREFYKVLKLSSYADTVNRLFTDNINTVILSADIIKLNLYTLGKKNQKSLVCGMDVTWKLFNGLDEPLDTIQCTAYSEPMKVEGSDVDVFLESEENVMNDLLNGAFKKSFQKLQQTQDFKSNMIFNKNHKISDPVLMIDFPSNPVKDKSEANSACVVIKTEKAHGSGFAVSSDGYVLTSYHTIEEALKKSEGVKVVTSDGDELQGEITRYNRYRNVALVKTAKRFEKVFVLPAEKTYKPMEDVMTIGAPKSVELGMSLSAGVISNNREVNNNYYIQLNMSINSGNSGGPLFNGKGDLYGMVVAKLTGRNTEGVSFAVPAYLLPQFLNLQYKK